MYRFLELASAALVIALAVVLIPAFKASAVVLIPAFQASITTILSH